MKLIFRASFFLFIFFLLSCKKDKKDTIPPSITWISPTAGQAYKMYDTLTVSATVTDNEHLSYINVTLTDVNRSPLQASYSVPITSAGFTFNIKYILTQFHLQSGNYLMQITADDGYNTISSYQPIYITESPTQLWGYTIIIKGTPPTINFVDTANPTVSLSTITLSQAYNGMKYGAYNQQLYVNGKGVMPFQSFNAQIQSITQTANYSASATVSQVDYTCLYTDGNKPYVGFLNSDIYSFDNVGAYNTSYHLNDINFYPYCFTKTSNYGVGVYKSKNTTNPDKIVSFTGYGAFFNSSTLPTTNFKVVAMFENGQDSVYVFGNDANNNPQVYIYYANTNSFSNAFSGSPAGSMLSAVKISSGYVLFSTTSGVYSSSSTSINPTPLIPTGAQKLVYQPKLNRLTVAAGLNLKSYSVGTGSLTAIFNPTLISYTDSIVDFEVITNK
jgi:hypothetical protein